MYEYVVFYYDVKGNKELLRSTFNVTYRHFLIVELNLILSCGRAVCPLNNMSVPLGLRVYGIGAHPILLVTWMTTDGGRLVIQFIIPTLTEWWFTSVNF